MKLLNNIFVKRIIVILSVIIMLTFFCLAPTVDAATKTKMEDGEFYYAGTTTGAYVVTEGVFAWLLSKIGEIADFLLGLFTMGGRMVFVGWTALFEEILTGALQATTGVPMDVDTNATQLDGFISSSNNVTLEAIVYNKVPIFNVNLFNPKEASRCRSGTGNYWVKCETCAEPDDKDGLCRMETCTCTECETALADAGVQNVNLITIIQDNVRMWYYVIRLLAMAAMLLVLIGIGIKMALTSIAQEKAMYKRMLVDWLVGIIILFTMQYVMIFIINLNEVLVDVIKDVQTGVTEITKKEFNVQTMDNQELEISVYQAVRTRAYDAKLINGTTGMILYISLVFMAFKYVFIYIKRYFAIIVLTLMSPGVALSYALQKVLTGKSKSFSNWLQEYFINVIIQTIHALIYTAFISMSLVISLNSISGMIVALVIMNYMASADKLFKKIFKLSGGSGSISEETSNANAKQLINSAKSAATFMTANSLLKKSPITKAVKAPLKMAGNGLVLGAVKVKGVVDEKTGASAKKAMKQMEKDVQLNGLRNRMQEARKKLVGTKTTKAFSNYFSDYNESTDVIGLDGEDAMEKELADLEQTAYEGVVNGDEGAEERYNEIQRIREEFDSLTTLTTGQVFKAHISEFLNKDNYYTHEYTGITEKDIRKEMNRHGEGAAFKRNPDGSDAETEEQYEARRAEAVNRLEKSSRKTKRKYGVFGKLEYDHTQGKLVRHTMNELISEQLSSKNLLGWSDSDKKLMKESLDLFTGTLVGVGSLFVGMGTLVESPGAGIGFLANGINKNIQFAEKAGFLDPNRKLAPRVSNKNKRYSFKRFNKGAKQTIMKAAIAQAEGERNKVIVQNVEKNHKTLYRALKLGGAGLTVAGAIGAAPAVMAVGVPTYFVGKTIKRYSGRQSNNSLLSRIGKQQLKGYETAKKNALKDEIDIMAKEEEIEFNRNYEHAISILSGAIDAEADRSSPQAIKEREELGLRTEAIVSTPTGEKIVLEEPSVKKEHLIIQEAVTEMILKRATREPLTMDSLRDTSDVEQIKIIIEAKLKKQGDISAGQKAEDVIVDLESKIATTKQTVLKGEVVRSERADRTPPSQPTGNRQNNGSSLDSSTSADRVVPSQPTGNAQGNISVLEQAIIKESIKELVQSGTVKSAKDITPEQVAAAVKVKRERIAGAQTTQGVLDNIKSQRPNDTSTVEPNIGSVQPDKGRNPMLEILGGTAGKNISEYGEISVAGMAYIQSTVANIQRVNTPPPPPKTARVRQEEKQKRIKALDAILTAYATGNEQVNMGTKQNEDIQDVDAVVAQLISNTAEKEALEVLYVNMDRMKKINRRGERMKMSSRDPKYHSAKRRDDRSKAQAKYPDLVPSDGSKTADATKDGTKSYDQTKDGSKDVSKIEAYGPVTDIVDLINKNRGK